MITTEQLIARYGEPNPQGTPYLTKLTLLYPMVLSWEKQTVIHSFTCHNLIKDNLDAVFNDILSQYGIDQIKALGIDRYGGCFNYRKMRNGTSLSRHSWGVAVDLDPDRNLLNENHTTARFARPEYAPMIDIFYNHGFKSLGREKDYDWMHFEIGS